MVQTTPPATTTNASAAAIPRRFFLKGLDGVPAVRGSALMLNLL